MSVLASQYSCNEYGPNNLFTGSNNHDLGCFIPQVLCQKNNLGGNYLKFCYWLVQSTEVNFNALGFSSQLVTFYNVLQLPILYRYTLMAIVVEVEECIFEILHGHFAKHVGFILDHYWSVSITSN